MQDQEWGLICDSPLLGPGLNPSAGQTQQQHSTPSSSQKPSLWSTSSKPRKKKFTRVSGMCGLWKHRNYCYRVGSFSRNTLRQTPPIYV